MTITQTCNLTQWMGCTYLTHWDKSMSCEANHSSEMGHNAKMETLLCVNRITAVKWCCHIHTHRTTECPTFMEWLLNQNFNKQVLHMSALLHYSIFNPSVMVSETLFKIGPQLAFEFLKTTEVFGGSVTASVAQFQPILFVLWVINKLMFS